MQSPCDLDTIMSLYLQVMVIGGDKRGGKKLADVAM